MLESWAAAVEEEGSGACGRLMIPAMFLPKTCHISRGSGSGRSGGDHRQCRSCFVRRVQTRRRIHLRLRTQIGNNCRSRGSRPCRGQFGRRYSREYRRQYKPPFLRSGIVGRHSGQAGSAGGASGGGGVNVTWGVVGQFNSGGTGGGTTNTGAGAGAGGNLAGAGLVPYVFGGAAATAGNNGINFEKPGWGLARAGRKRRTDFRLDWWHRRRSGSVDNWWRRRQRRVYLRRRRRRRRWRDFRWHRWQRRRIGARVCRNRMVVANASRPGSDLVASNQRHPALSSRRGTESPPPVSAGDDTTPLVFSTGEDFAGSLPQSEQPASALPITKDNSPAVLVSSEDFAGSLPQDESPAAPPPIDDLRVLFFVPGKDFAGSLPFEEASATIRLLLEPDWTAASVGEDFAGSLPLDESPAITVIYETRIISPVAGGEDFAGWLVLDEPGAPSLVFAEPASIRSRSTNRLLAHWCQTNRRRRL